MQPFKLLLREKLEESKLNNFGVDNFDEHRFGKYPGKSTPKIAIVKSLLKKLIGYNSVDRLLGKYEKKLQRLYDYLNKDDKELYVKLIAYRVLGYKKVKLPNNNKEYWEAVNLVDSLEKNATSRKFDRPRLNLGKAGYDLDIYFKGLGIAYTFIFEQYAYKNKNGETIVGIEDGDVIMDLGACYGDTALYFAEKQGVNQGKVYSFEFIPNNITVFNANVALNPRLMNQIQLVPHPVSNKSGEKIYFNDLGPGSRMAFTPFKGYTDETTTLSIDDFVKNNKINKVDFIKMDIEGAELLALEGAVETIKKFKPKLAIAIYHSWDDFVDIPAWIANLNLGYELNLGHHTIHSDETIIFAKIDNE